MSKQFLLGLFGGIFGILGGILAILVGGAGEALGQGTSDLYLLGASAILFSFIGILCGTFDQRAKVRGIGMVISGVAVLISISLFGILTAILFMIGGIVILKHASSSPNQSDESHAVE